MYMYPENFIFIESFEIGKKYVLPLCLKTEVEMVKLEDVVEVGLRVDGNEIKVIPSQVCISHFC